MTIERFSKCIKYGAAGLGLVAAILLFCSLTITSSQFKPIVNGDQVLLCFNGKKLAAGFGGPLALGDPCQGWNEGKPAALVSGEHPSYVRWGLGFLLASFILQLLDIEVSARRERRGGDGEVVNL